MGQKLYLECYAGISGDMFVAALIDLGVDAEYLIQQLGTLPLNGYKINIGKTQKMALTACDFDVVLDVDNHDHDMEYLHGKTEHEEQHHHHIEHNHDHHHSHNEHEQSEHHKHHHHEHRNLAEVLQIIEASQITDNAKALACKIFDILAVAEAKAHGVDKDKVHFHEVGAVDSIVDIVAAAVCIDKLQIEDVVCSTLSEGRGTVRCQHGKIPIPVPAVVNIVSSYGLKMHFTDVEGELITPTGAAIIAAIKTEDNLPDSFIIEKVGVGAGKRQYNIPNVVRAMLIK